MSVIHGPEGLFDTHTDVQNEWFRRVAEDGSDAALAWLATVQQGYAELSLPMGAEFTGKGILELDTDPTFPSPKRYRLPVTVENLRIGQDYYWRTDGDVHTFRTVDVLPRFLHIDGLFNVRDLGGDKIRQGLVYRGSELDCHYAVTEEGKRVFCDELGIRTQLDLRAERLGKGSPVEDRVRLVQIPYRPYREVFEEQHRRNIVKIMDVFADPENYPIYFHCWAGADRTGMIALFLKALAGESDDVIHTDYETTSLSSIVSVNAAPDGAANFRCRTKPYYTEFLQQLAEYAPEQPLSVQVPVFLRDCGVTEKTLQRIKLILKGEYSK